MDQQVLVFRKNYLVCNQTIIGLPVVGAKSFNN